MIDTHAHLDDDQFDRDREAIIARAHEAGVTAIVAMGTTVASSVGSLEIAQRHEGVFAAVGIHPNYTHEAAEGDWDRVVQLAAQPRVVAIGETGLDRYRDYAPFELQQDYFDRHLRLSQETGLPFVVHTRSSDDEVLAMLRAARERGPLSGVMHSFTGGLEMATQCLELGMHISFAGMLTFKANAALREVAAAVPRDRLLVETDCPYLAPIPFRGKRNEPAYVMHTAACLAELHGLTVAQLDELTTANARRLFRLP